MDVGREVVLLDRLALCRLCALTDSLGHERHHVLHRATLNPGKIVQIPRAHKGHRLTTGLVREYEHGDLLVATHTISWLASRDAHGGCFVQDESGITHYPKFTNTMLSVCATLALAIAVLLAIDGGLLIQRVTLAMQSARDSLPDLWLPQDAKCAAMRAPFNPDPFGAEVRDGVRGQSLRACEHFVYQPDYDITVLSCDPGRFNWNAVIGPLKDPTPRGALWVHANNNTQRVPIDGYPADHEFHPLGIALWKMDNGAIRVFATNHARVRSSVEVIDMFPTKAGWHARFVRTVSHPAGTHAVNSLVALGPTSFIVTNTHVAVLRAPPVHDLRVLLKSLYGDFAARYAHLLTVPSIIPLLHFLDTLFGFGFVAHVSFDGPPDVAVNVLAQGIQFPNGIALTPTQRALVVASTVYPGVQIYTLPPHPDWSQIKLSSPVSIQIPFFADNIVLGRRSTKVLGDPLDGHSVIVAGHPSAKDMEDHSRPLPSWVVNIYYAGVEAHDDAPVPADVRSRAPRGWTVRTLAQSDGNGGMAGEWVTIPAPTTAGWIQNNAFLISTLFNDVPIVCTGMDN